MFQSLCWNMCTWCYVCVCSPEELVQSVRTTPQPAPLEATAPGKSSVVSTGHHPHNTPSQCATHLTATRECNKCNQYTYTMVACACSAALGWEILWDMRGPVRMNATTWGTARACAPCRHSPEARSIYRCTAELIHSCHCLRQPPDYCGHYCWSQLHQPSTRWSAWSSHLLTVAKNGWPLCTGSTVVTQLCIKLVCRYYILTDSVSMSFSPDWSWKDSLYETIFGCCNWDNRDACIQKNYVNVSFHV